MVSTNHTDAEPPPSPFAELAEIYQRLEEQDLHRTVHGSIVKQLLDAARRIEAVHHTAAGMQLGAEGFDNTHAASLYSGVQQHLLTAARELVTAAAALQSEEELWARLRS
jgi:hypothetical protein